MDAIVKMLEKHQPFFEKISRNVYLQAIKDGFLGCMPIVLTSSIFLLIATLPGVVGITLPQPLIDWCNKLYNFTMGVMGIMVAGTTAKNFTASMNRRMPAGKVLNDGSTMVAAQCSMLLLAVTQFTTKFNGSELSVFDCTSMGTRGLFSAYIAAFITVWVYKFCVSRDLTIKLPKEVPGAIAQNFRDIIPFGGAVIICGIIDVVVRNLMGVPFSELLIKLLSPLFTAAETYPGLILIQAATAFFWFIGVHGPSIVQPGIDPIRLANQAENLQVLLAGGHPAHSLTFNMSLVGEFGGTGATFIVPLLLILFMKSKQLKAVGKASIVPVAFAVNEPLLFGAPMILNPYMLIPFVAAGCVNVSVAKFFIDNVGMNGFSFVVPWATPAPIGIFITTNFQLIALVFVAIIILLDAIIYLPFLKAYDKLLCDQEAERAAELGLEVRWCRFRRRQRLYARCRAGHRFRRDDRCRRRQQACRRSARARCRCIRQEGCRWPEGPRPVRRRRHLCHACQRHQGRCRTDRREHRFLRRRLWPAHCHHGSVRRHRARSAGS